MRAYQATAEQRTAFREKYDAAKKWPKQWSEVPTGYGYPGEQARTVSIEEFHAIKEYGRGEFNYPWNQALRSNDPARIAKHDLEIKMLASALRQLPAFEGTVARHIDVDMPASVLAQYQVGQVVTERAFTSTSTQLDADSHIVPGRTNVLLRIESKGGGRSIQGFTPYNEDEVLFAPGTRFKVKSRREETKLDHLHRPWKYEVMELEEVGAQAGPHGAVRWQPPRLK